MVRALIVVQWLLVLLYSKYGYFDIENTENWTRFFALTNQLILVCWVLILSTKKISRDEKFKIIFFNICLALMWAQHYIPFLNTFVETNGLLVPVLSFIIMCLFVDYFVTLEE